MRTIPAITEAGVTRPAEPLSKYADTVVLWACNGTEYVGYEAGDALPPPPPPPSSVPQEVTKRQALQALILAELDDEVDAALAAIPGIPGKLARAEWAESKMVERNRPLVKQMTQTLGWTEQQVDQLFITAASLP